MILTQITLAVNLPAQIQNNSVNKRKVDLSLQEIIHLTLENNPAIKLASNNVKQSYAKMLSSRGEFDPTLTVGADYGTNKNPVPFGLEVLLPEQRNTNYNIGLSKKFDWGLLINPNIRIMQSDAEFLDTREQQTQSAFNFTMMLPLLRNRGFDGTGAIEKSNEISLSSEKKRLGYSVSTEIRNSINSYLDLLQAEKRFEIMNESGLRAEKIVELTKILIKADKRPARELDIVNANLADKKLSTLLAKKDLFYAKQKLFLSVGLSSESSEEITINGTELELEKNLTTNYKFNVEEMINLALQKRKDYLSTVNDIEAVELQKANAERNTLNQLNLTMNIGYSGWERGSDFNQLFSNLYPREKGLNYTIGLNYELPIFNSLKEADLISRTAEYDNSLIRKEDLRRNIRSQVEIALKNVETSLLEIDYSKNSVELYKLSYENENLKQQKGLSTFLDVELTEEKLTSAMLNEINAKVNYLKSILELKYAIGSLVVSGESESSYSINANELFDIEKFIQ